MLKEPFIILGSILVLMLALKGAFSFWTPGSDSVISTYKGIIDDKQKFYEGLLKDKDSFFIDQRRYAAKMTQSCIQDHYALKLNGRETEEEFYQEALKCSSIIRGKDTYTLAPEKEPKDPTFGNY